MTQHREPWEGGFIRRDSRGRATFIIKRRVSGKPYEVSTRAHSRSAALEHLRRFEADPEAYDPRGTVRPEAILLDEDLSKDFLDWSKAKGNSQSWRLNQRAHLSWWAGKLKGVDLRRANLRDHVLPALVGERSRAQRIAVIKCLYSWLRTEVHRISTAEDPCYGQLKSVQARPEQWTRSKVIPRESLDAVREHLAAECKRLKKQGRQWDDLLTVLMGTGLHVTELVRFCTGGAVEPPPKNVAAGTAAVLVIPLTKAGDMLRVAVSDVVQAAAVRARKAGSFSREEFDRTVRAACAEVDVDPFTPAQLRHTVATWAVEAGADLGAVATFLNHKSPRTTRRFYATLATPTKVPTLV